MCGPGAYRPDPSEGITATADLPPPEMVPYSRNDQRNVCPRCGHAVTGQTRVAASLPIPTPQDPEPDTPSDTGTQAAPAAVPGEDVEVVTPSRMRLAIAEHMVRSKRTAPHATTVVEVDMTNIARWLEKNKEDFKRREGYGISYVPFVMKAVCEGIRKFPMINSSWTEDNKILVKKRINLGIAVATDVGLLVPTIYD